MLLPLRSILGTTASLLIAGAVGYGALAQQQTQSPAQPPAQPPAQQQTQKPTPQAPRQPQGPEAQVRGTQVRPTEAPGEQLAAVPTTSLDIYQLDRDCKAFGVRKVVLPQEASLEAAIQETLDANVSQEFAIAGYRVTLTNGVATVDVRRAGGSDRLFTSLSICEQLALFGSLRRTLVSNGQLGVTQVRFTSQGQALRL